MEESGHNTKNQKMEKHNDDTDGLTSKGGRGTTSNQAVVHTAVDDENMDRLLMAKMSAESEHLLSIFPKELWHLVIDQLNDSPENLEALNNSFPFFRDLLEPKKVSFLFPKILKLAIPQLCHTKEEVEYGDVTHAISSILECRFVCSTWANSLDELIQSGPNFNESENYKKLIGRARENTFNVMTPENLTSFLHHFQQTHQPNSERNPFISRNIHICFLDRVANNQEFINQIKILFDNYGHHVRDLDVYLEYDSDAPILETIRNCLAPSRNLKWLKIFNNFETDGRVNFRETEAELTERPLPHFHSLEKLETSQLSISLANELIRKSRQLSSLDVYSDDKGDYDVFAILTLNLKSLGLDIHSVEFFQEFCRSLEATSSRGLTSLRLSFNFLDDANAFIPFSEICQVVQDKWSGTLEKLTLYIPGRRSSTEALSILRDSLTFRLNLPKLCKLKLKTYNRIHLDFLLDLEDSLQDLTIVIQCNKPRRECKTSGVCDAQEELENDKITPIIQFEGYENRMMESNIWYLLPHLDKLSLTGYKYAEYYSGIMYLQEYKYTRDQWWEL